MTVEDFAPAKLNLALHVTGRRANGYHDLDSLVVFAGVGDRVSALPAPALTLSVTGPEAAALAGEGDNLVLKAARVMAAGRGAALTLDKVLPVASGIGGGSADAAAALRALARLWDCPTPDAAAVMALGADVPVCLAGQPARMSGLGERLAPVPALPGGLAVVLVNPRIALATPAVFAALERRDNPAMEPMPGAFRDAEALVVWLRRQRNDLEAPAIRLVPAIEAVLAALSVAGARLVRMSGSGATCFGLHDSVAGAETAAKTIAAREPGWWVRAAPLLP